MKPIRLTFFSYHTAFIQIYYVTFMDTIAFVLDLNLYNTCIMGIFPSQFKSLVFAKRVFRLISSTFDLTCFSIL